MQIQIKISREKESVAFLTLPWLWFLGYDTKSIHNKSKNKQVGLFQTKNLLYDKGNNQQNEKVINRMGENIFKMYAW